MSAFLSQFRRVPPVTLVLIALNVIAYLAFNVGLYPNAVEVYNSWVISADALLHGEYYTLITSMFLHAGLMHILCNMLSLYYLGVMCEKIYGPVRYLIIYFLSGIVGGIVFCVINYLAGDPSASAVGASGAIFGLFGVYGWILIKEHKFATVLGQPTTKEDIKAYAAILLVNLAIGFAPGSGIANEAHIGGMITGFVLGMIFYGTLSRVRNAARTAKRTANMLSGNGGKSSGGNRQSRTNAGSQQTQRRMQNAYANRTRQNVQQQVQQQPQIIQFPYDNDNGYSVNGSDDEKQAGQYNPYK